MNGSARNLLLSALLACTVLLVGCERPAPAADDHDAAEHHDEGEAENRTQIGAAAAQSAGVAVETAGPRLIQDILPLYGVIAPEPEAVRTVSARFPGPVRTVAHSLGDSVARGDVLATIESNESLQVYSITAPIAGVVTSRNANPGEFAGGEPLFEVTDYSRVMAELAVFARDMPRVRRGQKVRVRAVDGDIDGSGEVTQVIPGDSHASHAMTVRVHLDNGARRWTPGLYVNAEVQIGGQQVAVAVRNDALQTWRDSQVIFLAEGETYSATPVVTGRSDGEWIEIREGITAGARYVARNSFLIKAELGKAGAAHEH